MTQAMAPERIAHLLGGPHQAVLSVARRDKGPLAVPISYHYAAGCFWMVTSPATLHGRLMESRRVATITVQHERVEGPVVDQWYVIAEGPVRFTDDDPLPHVRTIMAKDRGARYLEAWMSEVTGDPGTVAVLEPRRISGYEWRHTAPPLT